jgi:restriction endonuclease S subunit
MKWKSTALGEVMRHRKGSITIDDTTSYKLCRVQLHRRGVVLRQNLNGAAISTKKQQVCKAGDFLVAEMDAKVGGYGFVPAELDGAIVSSHYYLFEVDAEKLHPEYLEVVSQAEILQQQIVAKGSTNYSSIRPGSVLEWKIPLPLDLEVQKQIARNFRSVQSKLAAVCEEITNQQSLLAKLKQAILQEAIQGKLTADWRAAHPDVEPASQLLHRIQAEKARLIAAKKLRPEKPLPPITPAEIPFEIPKGWEWSRFGQITRAYEAGSSFKCEDREVVGEEWGVIKTSAVTSGDFAERENKFLRADAPADTTAQIAVGDLIFCRASGSKGLAGKCAIVRECSRNLLLSDKTIRVPLMEGVSQEYVALHNDSAQAKAYFAGLGMGKSTSMNNVTRDDLFLKPVPLPPLAEQAAIVERVEALMTTCRALEAEIEHTRTHAAHLLQAVLKEAFAPD